MLQVINAIAVVGGMGLLFAVVGGTLAIRSRGFRRRAHRARGLVVGLRPNRSGPGEGAAYHAVIRYTTRQGVHVEAETPFASNPPPARPGQQVGVLYDPDVPTQVRIDSAMGSGVLLGLIFFAVGIGMLVVMVVIAAQELATF
ncbi:DUF3592 domain-containing protein [Nonomuraea terrae]|uniref:DUF3592 domain-containing protein n=1 Tax=Nonomuraea terrae TaxID=2530383 RepID=A0A4V2YL63_9ACTN|nr:DUF3592 domain-containing protein [Nonomuraea terrae]TDD45187.1 DUF3592 domain-containing protein [Nonomuraea terrae]